MYNIVKKYKAFFKINAIVFIIALIMVVFNFIIFSLQGNASGITSLLSDMKLVFIVSGCATVFYFVVTYKMKKDGVDVGGPLFEKKKPEITEDKKKQEVKPTIKFSKDALLSKLKKMNKTDKS